MRGLGGCFKVADCRKLCPNRRVNLDMGTYSRWERNECVIRHKWVGAPGEKAIDTALEKLINEAETNGKKSP